MRKETASPSKAIMPREPTGLILVVGVGDVIKKQESGFSRLRELGYQFCGLDVAEKPAGLDTLQPIRLFLRENEKHHSELMKMFFDAIYVSNPGNFHMTTAIEFQHCTKNLIITKPLDALVGLLLDINNNQGNYIHVLNLLVVQDHYTNKDGVEFLRDIMSALHTKHAFIDTMVFFIVERERIEVKEIERIETLENGMLFDLAVHALSDLQMLVPEHLEWMEEERPVERIGRKIVVEACETGRYSNCYLRESTVMRDRLAETFGVMQLRVEEKIRRKDSGETFNLLPFRVLIVVGKGVPSEQGAKRDLKNIIIRFRDGAEVSLDIDTYGIRGVEEEILRDYGFSKINFNEKGLSKGLRIAGEKRFALKEEGPFQLWTPAFENVMHLHNGLLIAPPQCVQHPAGESCRNLLNRMVRRENGFINWMERLPGNFGDLHIAYPDIQGLQGNPIA